MSKFYNFEKKANLRDLIAVTDLVILLKLDSNTLSFLHHFVAIGEFKLELVRKRLIWVKIDDFFNRVTLKFDGKPSKTIRHLFSVTSSFVQHFVAIFGAFKLELQSGNA